MLNKVIMLVLMAFMAFAATTAAKADSPAPAAVDTASMSDEALASYISGRLSAALKDQNYSVSNSCDDSGCSVVVQ